MRVESTEVDFCKLEVFYESDESVINEKIEEAIAELRKVQIPGFRKGKAPDYAIKAKCKKQIEQFVIRQMGTQAFDDIVFETGAKPIGHPHFSDVKLKNNTFSCKVSLLKKPDFELASYSAFELTKPSLDRDVSKQVQQAVDSLKMRFGSQRMFEEGDVLERGDQITMSFVGTLNGESFDGGIAEGELYVVGRNKFPDFDQNILGMKAGEVKEFDITFPEEIPSIGGKTAHFSVTVHMASRLIPCEINEEFLKTIGVGSDVELYDHLKQLVEKNIADNEREALASQVVEKLLANHDFRVPTFLVESEAKSIIQNKDRILSLEDAKNVYGEEFMAEVMKTATDRVKMSLILDAIRENEPDSMLSDVDVQNAVINQARSSGIDPQKFLVEAQKNGSILGIVAALRDQFALQWVINTCSVKEV